MSKFIDENGLATLWNLIKNYVDSKSSGSSDVTLTGLYLDHINNGSSIEGINDVLDEINGEVPSSNSGSSSSSDSNERVLTLESVTSEIPAEYQNKDILMGLTAICIKELGGGDGGVSFSSPCYVDNGVVEMIYFKFTRINEDNNLVAQDLAICLDDYSITLCDAQTITNNSLAYYNLTTTGEQYTTSTHTKYVDVVGKTFDRAMFTFYPNGTSDYLFYEYNGGAHTPNSLSVKSGFPVQISIFTGLSSGVFSIIYNYYSSSGTWATTQYMNISISYLSNASFSANVVGILMQNH